MVNFYFSGILDLRVEVKFSVTLQCAEHEHESRLWC